MEPLASTPIRVEKFTTNQASIVISYNFSQTERMVIVIVGNNNNINTMVASTTKFTKLHNNETITFRLC
jgi:hypothetical protein